MIILNFVFFFLYSTVSDFILKHMRIKQKKIYNTSIIVKHNKNWAKTFFDLIHQRSEVRHLLKLTWTSPRFNYIQFCAYP